MGVFDDFDADVAARCTLAQARERAEGAGKTVVRLRLLEVPP